MKTYYISDLHFGHKRIQEFEPEARGKFSSVEQMNEHIISQWNSVVTNEDEVVLAGDVFLSIGPEEAGPLLKRLNGKQIILVMGNHDSEPRKYKLFDELGWKRVGVLDRYNGVVVTHIPIHPSSLLNRWNFNFHGHTHSAPVLLDENWPDPRYINLAVEVHDFVPKTKQQLLEGRN